MAGNDLNSFKSALDGIKTELGSLKENIASISRCIEASQLVSDEMVQALSDVLARYRGQYKALRDAGDCISISIGVDINEIENSLRVYEESQTSKQLREVVLDYFRLNAESARVRTSLEESKRKLMEKCLLPVSELSGEIRAYEIVVENARNPQTELPEPEFQLLEDTFGLRIADASDNRLLSIEENANLEAYLNGSCRLLMPINAERSCIQQAKTDTGAENIEDSNDEPRGDSQTDDNEKSPVQLWEDFHGYIDGVTVNTSDTVVNDEPTIEDIHAITEEHCEFPYILSTLANEKLLLPLESMNAQRYDFVPLHKFVESLTEKGFVTTVEVSFEGESKLYLTLTDKGWSCFRNADIHKAISDNASYFVVPEHVKVCAWTNVSLFRTSAICEFMNVIGTRGIVVHAEDSSFVFAYANNVNGVGSMVSTALFEKGNELTSLAWLKNMAMSCKESAVNSFIVLVSNKEDIAKVHPALMLPDEIQMLVKYAVIGGETKIYDLNGDEVNSNTDTKAHAEERSAMEMPDSDSAVIGESDTNDMTAADVTENVESREHVDEEERAENRSDAAKVFWASDSDSVDLECLLSLEAPNVARYLLEKDITPESTDAYLLLVEKLVEANIVTSTNDGVVNTLSQAIALLKALSSIDPVYQLSYQRVLLAMDSQIQHHAYTGSALNCIFTDDQPGALAHPVLKLMAYIRAMFTHDTAYDHEFNSMAKGIFDYYEDNFPGLEILKPLYNLLLKVGKYLPAGFAMPILRRFGDEKAQKEQMSQINQRAKELVQLPTVKSGLGAMVPMLRRCFGPESDLYSCMEIISSNDLGYREVVRLVFEDFCEADSSGELVLSDSRIDKMFEDNWKKAIEEIHGPRMPFVSQKNKVTDNIRERLELMDQWLQATSADEGTLSNWSHIQSLRVEIMAELDRVDRELTERTFNSAIIRAGVGKIRKKLQGRFVSDSIEFVDMLRTGIFCLDDRGMPFMDDTYANVRYYEPWRNMLRHIAAPVEDFFTVLDGITDNTNLRLFDNFGQAIQICNYLNAHCETNLSIDEYQQDIERGKKKAHSDAEKFKGELEMAFAYGRIIEQFKEYMQDVLEHAVDSFSSFNNYACLRNLIIALRRMIDDEASSAVKRLTKEIEERMSTQPEEKLRRMLEMARGKLDEPERNYAVAEEYINRYDAGVSDCLGLREEDSNNAFLRFVNDEIDKLYSLCSKNGNYALRQFGAEYVTKALEKKRMSAQYKGSALTLVKSMPNRPDEIKGGETIANLLREIGFDVVSVRKTHIASGGNQIVRLSVDVRPDAKDKSEYPHPVDIMGTKLGSPLDVVCLFGKMQPNDIVDKVCKLELNRTAIVLLNGPFDVAARRQMAERFHREKSGRNPFLLVDWVLLLYLATYQKTERMAVMLSCTLPYTSSFKPFVIKGTVPDEMFIGRKSELNRILDPNGPCIVYGGRQLGKTALLERALSLANHSDRREYAVLVRAAAISTESDLVSALVMELNMHKLGIPTATSTMNELCMSLKQKYEEGKWTKILAMVDEADMVLSNFRTMNPVYKPIIPLSDLCRSTGNSFKFVFAGLHNVCRAASDPNTIFGQLGGALCIKPLNAFDAYELLSRPLRYMGFKIAPDKLEHILVNTSFYPGIIHHVGYSLVENLSTKYSEYYSAARGNPPYELTDKQLGEIMSGDALNEKINERIRWTLEVDPRYFMIARCIAYLDCEDPGENNRSHSVELIMEYAELLGISSLAGLDKSDYEGLLKELEDMGILVAQDEKTYRLRQRRFLEAIGNTCKKIEDDIQKAEGA